MVKKRFTSWILSLKLQRSDGRITLNKLLASVLMFQKYILWPKGSLCEVGSFFSPADHKAIDMPALSWHCHVSLWTLNADCCSLHNSPGPFPGYSIVIQLFLDKLTQIHIYSCLQVRCLNEPQHGWSVWNCVSTNMASITNGFWSEIFKAWRFLLL